MKNFLLATLIAGRMLAQTASPEARQNYSQAASELFRLGVPLSAEGEKECIVKSRAIVIGEIQKFLSNQSEANPDAVMRIIADLQDEPGRRYRAPMKHEAPIAFVAQTNVGPVLAVAFSILKGSTAIPTPEPVIQFFSRVNGAWQQSANADPETLQDRWLQAARIRSPYANEVWLMAWGKTYGDTGSRLFARLYSFDALTSEIRILWRVDGLHRGDLEVQDSQVVLTYWDTYPPKGDPIRKVLTIGSAGLE